MGGTSTEKTTMVPTLIAAGQAFQLTPGNLWDVFEWVDPSKPYHSPDPDGDGTVITGLTVWVGTNRDRVKADAERMLAATEAASA